MSPLALEIAFAVGALLVTLAGCELFTNAIEWFGAKLNLSTGAVGSVLAAVGTALPGLFVSPRVLVRHHGGNDADLDEAEAA